MVDVEKLEAENKELKIKYERIASLFNAMNDKQGVLEQEVQHYKDRFFPKYKCGDKLFIVDIKDKSISNLSVDEITITKFGISYREFISETEWKQYPEQYCFNDKTEAESFLAQLKN